MTLQSKLCVNIVEVVHVHLLPSQIIFFCVLVFAYNMLPKSAHHFSFDSCIWKVFARKNCPNSKNFYQLSSKCRNLGFKHEDLNSSRFEERFEIWKTRFMIKWFVCSSSRYSVYYVESSQIYSNNIPKIFLMRFWEYLKYSSDTIQKHF